MICPADPPPPADRACSPCSRRTDRRDPPSLPYRTSLPRRGGGTDRCRAGSPTSPEGDARPSPEGERRPERSTVPAARCGAKFFSSWHGPRQSAGHAGVLLHQEKIQTEARGASRAGRGSTAGRSSCTQSLAHEARRKLMPQKRDRDPRAQTSKGQIFKKTKNVTPMGNSPPQRFCFRCFLIF
jgi:hypothetical protein